MESRLPAPAMLTELTEPQRQRALERCRQLRAHLEQDVPLAQIADAASVSYQVWVMKVPPWLSVFRAKLAVV